jgi:hypothetical protein
MALTFVPTSAPATAPVVPRGGSRLADIGVTLTPGSNGAALTLGRDARGGLGLVTGGDRLVSRVTRALLTELGTNVLNPGYGTEALPGLLLTQELPLRVADVAMREVRLSQTTMASPSNRVTRMQATAQVSPADPTVITLNLTISTADGAVTAGQLTGF